MRRYLIASLVSIVVSMTGVVAVGDDANTVKAAEWKLPKMERVDSMGFRVTRDGRYAVVAAHGRFDPKNPRPPKAICWLVDTTSGKCTNVADLLGDAAKGKSLNVARAMPSPDGAYLAVAATTTQGRGGRTLYLVRLKDGKVTQLQAGLMIPPVWVAGKLAISGPDGKGDIQQIRFYDPATGKFEDSKVRGLVASADANGQVMVVGCRKDAPTKPMSMRDFRGADTVTMSVGGTVLRRLGSATEVGTQPIFSAGGHCLAFQYNGRSKPGLGPPDVTRVDVMSVRGEQTRHVNEMAFPVHVDDDGTLITLGARFREDGAPIKLWDAQGNAKVLVKNVWAAAVAGKRLFYVTGTDEKVLKVVPLPR